MAAQYGDPLGLRHRAFLNRHSPRADRPVLRAFVQGSALRPQEEQDLLWVVWKVCGACWTLEDDAVVALLRRPHRTAFATA